MMGALIRALTNNAVENIEEALGMTDATSSAMKHAIAEWYAAWYGRAPTKTEDPCQRLPYAIVNKLCKATFGEYDSGLQHTDSAKGKYLDCVRNTFDACKTSFMTQAMIGGEAWAKPVPMPDGRLTWQIVGRDSIIILGRDASGIPSDMALCEKSVSADHHFYTLVERRTSFAGRLTIQYRLYCSDNKSTLGRRVPLASLPQYERLEDEYTFAVPIDGVGMVFLRMPITNCVDGSADGVSIYEPAMGLIHRINENELQFSREFELGRMRVVASADILRTHNGKKLLTDDVFVGLDGNEQSVGITPFAPALRNESYEARRQTYLKAIENLLGIKRGILSDAEAVSKTATEIDSSAGDYSLSIMDFQHLYYDALQAALRLGDQIGQAYRLCDASAWSADELTVVIGQPINIPHSHLEATYTILNRRKRNHVRFSFLDLFQDRRYILHGIYGRHINAKFICNIFAIDEHWSKSKRFICGNAIQFSVYLAGIQELVPKKSFGLRCAAVNQIADVIAHIGRDAVAKVAKRLININLFTALQGKANFIYIVCNRDGLQCNLRTNLLASDLVDFFLNYVQILFSRNVIECRVSIGDLIIAAIPGCRS